jgi:hypothetical protein
MKVTFTRNLPKTESYISTKKNINASLGHYEMLAVTFGLRRKFEFDSRCSNKPIIKGLVIVSVSITRSREILVSFYPVALTDLSADAITEFHKNTLQAISKWIDGMIGKPETAIVGVEQLIVEIVGNSFKFHQMTFL